MSLITLNYELAIAQAAKLEQAAADCASMASDVNDQIKVLSQAWSGESADLMLELLSQWSKETAAMEGTLSGLAKRVRSKADALKAADEESELNDRGFGSGEGGGGFR